MISIAKARLSAAELICSLCMSLFLRMVYDEEAYVNTKQLS